MSSSFKISSTLSTIGCLDFLTQSWVQIKASTMEVDKLVLYGSNTRPLVLKADSDATVDICIARISKIKIYKVITHKKLTITKTRGL